MIVVSDTTPLIGMAAIGRFDFLRQLFGEIHIARAVYDEIMAAKNETAAAKIRPEIEKLRQNGFSLSQAVIDMVLQQAGESEP